MRSNKALTDQELSQGYILSCQSTPVTEKIQIEF